MPELPGGTVTFLFTDIEGSTQLWEEHPEPMRAALARHDALVREAIESHTGHVFKTVGDAFCAAFPTATDAIAAALSAQQSLQNLPWGALADGRLQGSPLRVRIALHTGSAELRGGDYFGPTVNRVARLLSAGHGGQVLLSGATEELVQDELLPGASLRDLGLHRLRDLHRPEHIFQLLHPDLPADFPPLRSLDALPNNLPQQVTSFVGREKEIALEGVAAFAASEVQPQQAARLWGAAEALREVTGTPMAPGDRADYNRCIEGARAAMSQEAFATAWADGRAMRLEEALEEAMREL